MRYAGILIVLLFLAACQKDELPRDEIGKAVFVNEVTFNNTEYHLSAGENGLVMTPSFTATDSLIQFRSDLINPSCSSCGPALSIQLTSPPSVFPGAVSNWISELNSWQYAYTEMTGDSSAVMTLEVTNENGIPGNWYLNNNQLNQNMSASIEFEVVDPGAYELVFDAMDTLCINGQPMNFDFDGLTLPCYGSISQTPVNPAMLFAEPGPRFDTLNTTYTWIVDGNNIPTGNDPSIIVNSINNLDQVCVVIDDPNACQSTVCITPLNAINSCVNNVKITSSQLEYTTPEPLDLAILEIEFTDENQNTYYSTGGQNNASIQLVSINTYQEPTLPGEPYAEVVFEVQCNLYDQGGQAFPFSGIINMALALPD